MTDYPSLYLAVTGAIAGGVIAAVGFMLSRLIKHADEASAIRHTVLSRDIDDLKRQLAGLAKRQDQAMEALNDLIREAFERASDERSDLAQRLSRIEGYLGRPVLRLHTGE